MKSLTVLLLVATLPLMVVWYFVPDNNLKVDWVLLRDFEDKKKWYLQDTVFHLQNIIHTFIIWRLSDMFLGKIVAKITLIFFGFSIFRLIEYYMVHNVVPMLPFILCIGGFALLFYYTKK